MADRFGKISKQNKIGKSQIERDERAAARWTTKKGDQLLFKNYSLIQYQSLLSSNEIILPLPTCIFHLPSVSSLLSPIFTSIFPQLPSSIPPFFPSIVPSLGFLHWLRSLASYPSWLPSYLPLLSIFTFFLTPSFFRSFYPSSFPTHNECFS